MPYICSGVRKFWISIHNFRSVNFWKSHCEFHWSLKSNKKLRKRAFSIVMHVRSFLVLFVNMKKIFCKGMCFYEIWWCSFQWPVEKINQIFFWVNVLFVCLTSVSFTLRYITRCWKYEILCCVGEFGDMHQQTCLDSWRNVNSRFII